MSYIATIPCAIPGGPVGVPTATNPSGLGCSGCGGTCGQYGMSGLTMDGSGLFGSGIFGTGVNLTDFTTWGVPEYLTVGAAGLLLVKALAGGPPARKQRRKR